jgi:hypothetical protein
MDKKYSDALTYLASFDGGLSRYNWDRALTYKLKYDVHPGTFVQFFISEKLIVNEVPVSNTNYELSPSGKDLVKENLKNLKPILDRVDKALTICMSSGDGISVNKHPPYYEIGCLGSRISIWINRNNDKTEIVCSFPSETESKVNNLSLSISMIEKTDILDELIAAHIKYLLNMKLKPTA